jgi:hypothetical protein
MCACVRACVLAYIYMCIYMCVCACICAYLRFNPGTETSISRAVCGGWVEPCPCTGASADPLLPLAPMCEHMCKRAFVCVCVCACIRAHACAMSMCVCERTCVHVYACVAIIEGLPPSSQAKCLQKCRS